MRYRAARNLRDRPSARAPARQRLGEIRRGALIEDWSRRVARLRHVGTIARDAFVAPDPRTIGFDLSRRFIAWSVGWERGGIGIADLRDSRVLFEDPAHHTLRILPLHNAFGSQSHETRTFTVFRIDDRGNVERQESAPLGSAYIESFSPGGERAFLRGDGFSEIIAWPSFERITRFKGYGMEIDWEARRVLRRKSGVGFKNDAIEILDFEGEEITLLSALAYGSLTQLTPGIWARCGTGLRLLDVADGRDASVFLASRGHMRPPSLSGDHRALRFMVRGKPRRLEVDLGALTAVVSEELAAEVRVRGTDDGLFHPHADLFADSRTRIGWTIREFSGTPVLSLKASIPLAWSADGEVLLASHNGFIHVWQ